MQEESQNIPPKDKGSWAGIIIVIIIIALGGAYFWYRESGAMRALDERNKALESQSARPANLFR
jgi:hypothetical protein